MRAPHVKRFARPIAPKAHPLAREFFAILANEQTAITDIAERSGLGLATLVKWKYRHAPTVTALQAALNAVGYELVIRRQTDNTEAERAAATERQRRYRERLREVQL